MCRRFLFLPIALIGVANTLSLSISERLRELGLLRAVGMDRRAARVELLKTPTESLARIRKRWESQSSASSSPIIPSITPRPPCQKAGSRASSPNGARSSA